jgi:hypothetical protein
MGKTKFTKMDRQTVSCKFCGKTFVKKTWNQVFCSLEHKSDFFNAETSLALSEYYEAKRDNRILPKDGDNQESAKSATQPTNQSERNSDSVQSNVT